MRFLQGEFVMSENGKRYMVHHMVTDHLVACYICDHFGPLGSIVWIDSHKLKPFHPSNISYGPQNDGF